MSEPEVQRRLTTILAADVVGYSRLMAADEAGTHARMKTLWTDVIEPKSAEHHGRTVKLMGDGTLMEFASVVDAVKFSVDVQHAMAVRSIDVPEDQRIIFRIGINIGDIIVDGDDIFGDGVNVAARLEGIADPGGVYISASVYDQVRDRIDQKFEDLGEREVKNIDRPVRIYRAIFDGAEPAKSAARALPLPDKPSIIVIPFENLTGDPEQDFLTDGLRLDISNALVKVSGVFIIAMTNGGLYRGKSVAEATNGMGVRYALEGTVRRAGNRVRISTTLTDTVAGEIVWAEQFDRQLDDAFEVIDEVIGQILTAMNVKLVSGESARVWHKTLPDLRSLEAFYRGVHEFFKMDKSAMSESRRQFELVARLHPESAIGPTWIAATYWYEFQRGWTDSRDETKQLAREWAERAAPLPDTDGQAQTILSFIHLLDRDFEAALEAGRKGVENRPSCIHSNAFYANALHYCGEHEKAQYHIELAMRYAPMHPAYYHDILASTCRAAGDLDRAAQEALTAIETNPNDLTARLILASLAVKQDQPNDAAKMVEEVRNFDPEFSVAKFAGGQPYRSEAFLDQYLAELRDAGLPE
ncbi:MAG: guanylyl cyclase [Alphaproteobacteria bacterium]|nr:guanylyl cyclase [Alphaproteobacteria bacterium]